MEITRNVVRDLLPLYAVGEASEDSKRVVEAWLESDEELAREATALRSALEPGPPSLTEPQARTADELFDRTLRRVRRLQLVRFIVLVVNIFILGIPFHYGPPAKPWVFFAARPAGLWSTFVVGLILTLGAWLALAAWQRSLLRGHRTHARAE